MGKPRPLPDSSAQKNRRKDERIVKWTIILIVTVLAVSAVALWLTSS